MLYLKAFKPKYTKQVNNCINVFPTLLGEPSWTKCNKSVYLFNDNFVLKMDYFFRHAIK